MLPASIDVSTMFAWERGCPCTRRLLDLGHDCIGKFRHGTFHFLDRQPATLIKPTNNLTQPELITCRLQAIIADTTMRDAESSEKVPLQGISANQATSKPRDCP